MPRTLRIALVYRCVYVIIHWVTCLFYHACTTAAVGAAVIPSINYGIVIDAGSSSSKVYLFQWPTHDGDPTKLLKIEPLTDELDDSLIKKVEPGK